MNSIFFKILKLKHHLRFKNNTSGSDSSNMTWKIIDLDFDMIKYRLYLELRQINHVKKFVQKS